MDYVVLSSAELILAREKAAPTGRKVTDLLLRGGAIGYLDLRRLLDKSLEEDRKVFKDKRRINPVVLKSIMTKCGVLITPDDYRDLRRAYSDEGGFLVDEFLELVRPSRNLAEREAGVLRDMCADVINAFSSEVALDNLLYTFKNALTPGDDTTGDLPLLASALMETEMIFTPQRYPSHLVPVQDVVEAFAAILLNSPGTAESLLRCLARVRLPPVPLLDTSAKAASVFESSAFKRQDRGYEYYTDRDNRDEWIRGREAVSPGPMYQRFLPGYQGHLPTYRSKFGRSFHPIEESVPRLTCEKKPQEAVPVDRWGSAMELKGNWLNRHNFKFA